MFSLVKYERDLNFNPSMVTASILFFPIAFIYFPVIVLTGQHTNVDVIILDLESTVVERDLSIYTKEKPTRLKIGAHIYHFFNSIHKK
jgi:hypothetical protein